jgi:hypothetical protein
MSDHSPHAHDATHHQHALVRQHQPGDNVYLGVGVWGVVLPDGTRVADDHPEAYRARALRELRETSQRHAALDLFLRSPKSQTIDDAERAIMRHQLRALDECVYWMRQRVRLWGVQA